MCLAGILGLCALLYVSPLGAAGSDSTNLAPDSAQPAQTQSTPVEQARQEQSQPNAPKDETKSTNPSAGSSVQQSVRKEQQATKKRRTSSKKKTAPTSEDSQKTVVKHGSTAEPTTQLAPGITEEQAAKQKESTNQLLSSTDAVLQKIGSRELSSDQKETVAQIRKFMQQAKAAEAEGDPQRSYKLALKAHLLTDALEHQ